MASHPGHSLYEIEPQGRRPSVDLKNTSGASSVISGRTGAESTRSRPWHRDVEAGFSNTVRNRNIPIDLSDLPRQWVRQILGFIPFKTSYFSLYRYLTSWQDRSLLACAICCSIAAGVPLPLIGLIFGHIINDFPPPEGQLQTSLEELIGVAVAYFFVTWGWSICWGLIGERVSRGLREALVHRVVGMEMAYFDVENPDVSTILTGDTQSIQMGTSEKVGLFIQSISYFVAAFTVGFTLNAELTGILFAAVIPTMFLVVAFGTATVSRLSKKAATLSEAAAEVAKGAVGAVQVVQAFGAVTILADHHLHILTISTRVAVKKAIAGAAMLGLVFFTAYAANALAFWKGSQLVSGGNAGTVYAVVFLILDASFVIGQFGPFVQSLALASSAGEKIFDVIDAPTSNIDVYSEEGIQATSQTFTRKIEFREVIFVYPARPTVRVLDSVDLVFPPSATTAIVGLSGSGKSTVAALLLRLYDATSGKLMLGNEELKDFNVKSLRSHISLVDQEPVLFTGTVLENISHGIVNRAELTDEDVQQRCIKAATEANADFIPSLPHGIHTRVGGAGGTQLSGGQKQRICLARALVRNPDLLILDEPTSALDANSEALILEALRNVSCTIIMIAHRLATIRDADNIIVMEHGNLLEQGTHDELMEREGSYKTLAEAQQLELNAKTEAANTSSETSDMYTSRTEEIKNQLEKGLEGPNESENKKKEVPKMSALTLIRRCLRLSRPEWPYVAAGIVASLISGALILGEAIIFGNLVTILNTLSGTPRFASQVDFFCLMFFVIALVAVFAYCISGSSFGIVSEHLIRRTRDISLRTILRQDLEWFSEPGHSTHALIATINMDSGNLAGLSGVIIGTLVSVTTSIVGGIILAHIFAWEIAVVLLSAVPVMVVAGFLRLRVLAKFEQRHETAYNEAATLASEACNQIRTVAAFGRENDVLAQYRLAIQGPYRQSFKFITLGNMMLAFSLAITYFVYALAYWWGAQQVRDGHYSQKEFFIVLPALLFSAQAAGQMFSLAPEVTRAKNAANSVFALHDQQPTIMSHESALSQPNSTEAASEKQSLSTASPSPPTSNLQEKEDVSGRSQIQFHNVSLSYRTRPNVPIITNVSLTIRPGQFIGIVGASGAGKSSLISLIERFYEPTSGSISFNSAPIRDNDVAAYRAQLSLVAQEPDLFPGSISFNISLGARPGTIVSQSEIEEVCKSLNIHDFIVSLPSAYLTECGMNGSQLSGGQKQRIAIARALIRDPEVLLMDEPTASLDGKSEREVRDAVDVIRRKGKTVIFVAHRLASVQAADNIFVFDKGELVEQGTHEELVEAGGVYAGMAMAQDLS